MSQKGTISVENGILKTFNDTGEFHSFCGNPAIVYSNSEKCWYLNGKLHNSDKDENGFTMPAIVFPSGTKHWYLDGKLHNSDKDENGFNLPAIVYPDGLKKWYLDGKLIHSGTHPPEQEKSNQTEINELFTKLNPENQAMITSLIKKLI